MKTIPILLLDMDPQNAAGQKLEQILGDDHYDHFQVRHERVAKSDLTQAAKRLSAILATFSPRVTFFVFGSDSRSVMGVGSTRDPPDGTSGSVRRDSTVSELFTILRVSKTPQPVIAVVNSGGEKEVTEMLHCGANDFLIPPLRPVSVLSRVWRCVRETQPEEVGIHDLKEKLGLQQFIGESPALLNEIKKIPAVARSDASVLVTGETGTGKEICARAIHYHSPRTRYSFHGLNCGAIPADLVENELFGHEPGAFTGAQSSLPGAVRVAEGGTLFLDEIDSLPVPMQVKLLRLLQEKEFQPLGGQRTLKADVRVIAATNANLEESIRAGCFRQDLYFRLNVVTLTMPPLRDRHGDVPLLARHFLAKFATELGQPARTLSTSAMQKLALYEWPGNVRELQNVIKRSLILSERAVLQCHEIELPQPVLAIGRGPFHAAKADAIAKFEQDYIRSVLLENEGNIAKAARAAQKNRRAFFELMRKHGIHAHEPQPSSRVSNST